MTDKCDIANRELTNLMCEITFAKRKWSFYLKGQSYSNIFNDITKTFNLFYYVRFLCASGSNTASTFYKCVSTINCFTL